MAGQKRTRKPETAQKAQETAEATTEAQEATTQGTGASAAVLEATETILNKLDEVLEDNDEELGDVQKRIAAGEAADFVDAMEAVYDEMVEEFKENLRAWAKNQPRLDQEEEAVNPCDTCPCGRAWSNCIRNNGGSFGSFTPF